MAVNRGFGNFAKLFIPAGCIINHQEASIEYLVLSGFRDRSSFTISFETDKPVFSTGIVESTVESFGLETFQETFRDQGIQVGSKLVLFHVGRGRTLGR